MSIKVAKSDKQKAQQLLLRDTVVNALSDKKAENIESLNLSEVNDAICDYFIICHATSGTQVKAIADNVLKQVKDNLGEHPWHKEGFDNLEWVLIDYVDVVVHIFLEEKRAFYQLEDLWSDAEKETFE